MRAWAVAAGCVACWTASVLLRGDAFAGCLAAIAGVFVLAGEPVEALRLALAVAAVVAPRRDLALALMGLVLLRSGRRTGLDGASLGWGLMVASHAVATWTSPQSPLSFAFTGAGAFLLGGVWPFTGSWNALDEGWGRRIGRGVLALHALAVTMPSVPVAMEAWAPWVVFAPGLGVLWGAALGLSPSGQRSALALLWFFELQMAALLCLGTRGGAPLAVPLWGAVLPVTLLRTVTSGAPALSRGSLGAQVLAGVALASTMAVPGAVGFAARFFGLTRLLGSSPAGLVCFGVGLLAVPIFLRPLREELRCAACSGRTLIACGVLGAAILFFGVAPGLASPAADAVWLWRFLAE